MTTFVFVQNKHSIEQADQGRGQRMNGKKLKPVRREEITEALLWNYLSSGIVSVYQNHK